MAEPTPPVDEQPAEAEPAAEQAQPEPEPAPEAEAQQADEDQSDLVNRAIARGIPSYEAWALTPDELAKRLEA